MPQQNTSIPPTRAEVTVTVLIALGAVASGAACGAGLLTGMSAICGYASLEIAGQGAGCGGGLTAMACGLTWADYGCPFYQLHSSAGTSDASASLLSRDKDGTAPAASPEEM